MQTSTGRIECGIAALGPLSRLLRCMHHIYKVKRSYALQFRIGFAYEKNNDLAKFLQLPFHRIVSLKEYRIFCTMKPSQSERGSKVSKCTAAREMLAIYSTKLKRWLQAYNSNIQLFTTESA